MPSIKYKKKTYAGATFPVLEMTKAEYDALPEAKKMDGTVYMITDDTGGWEAENSVYDNSQSGLTATNVQDALDEIVTSTIPDLNKIITIPLTINSQGATGSGEVKVCGRVATISALIRPIITGTTMSLGWLQGGGTGIYASYAPSSTVWLSCDSYDASGTRATAEARMLSDTVLSVSTQVKEVDFKISGTWITKG